MVDSRSAREERRYTLVGVGVGAECQAAQVVHLGGTAGEQKKKNEKEERRLKKADGGTANTHMMGGLYQ